MRKLKKLELKSYGQTTSPITLKNRFFLRTKTFGHDTFCIALHVMKMDNFNYLNNKITNKNNLLSLMDKYYRQ